MFKIFPQTHKIIASEISKNIKEIHHIELDEKVIRKGSVIPDFALKYKLIRHYQDESLDFIASEIVQLIYISKFLNYTALDKINKKLLSTKIGIISHYLSDYVCLPHKERWTFKDSMSQHVRYESQLGKVALHHDFNKNILTVEDMDPFHGESVNLKRIVKSYIESVVEEYSYKRDYKRDLDFALSLNIKITNFIVEVVLEMNKQESLAKSFVF